MYDIILIIINQELILMNDSQKLDMLLEAMVGLTQKVTAMETEFKEA
jgi:hypothetical protein